MRGASRYASSVAGVRTAHPEKASMPMRSKVAEATVTVRPSQAAKTASPMEVTESSSPQEVSSSSQTR